MKFEFTEDQKQYRKTLCEFLSRELSPEALKANFDEDEMGELSPEFSRRMVRKMGQAGLIGASWPKEFGGEDKSMIHDFIFSEEIEYHGLSLLPGLSYIPPVLIAAGSDKQKREFLPRLRSGEIHFFLGYSEPEAGSDLASLQTRAVPKNGGFAITGDKLFSSYANFSDYGWVAARTDVNVPKHKGLSLFIVDMKSPGVSVKKHKTISGWSHPAVVFDDVWVPADMLVGQVNQGWQLIMLAIEHERAGVGNPGQVLRSFDRLLRHCRQGQRDGRPLMQDPIVRQKLAEAAIEVEALRLLAYQVGDLYSRGQKAESEANLLMLVKKETQRRLDRLGIELLGEMAQYKRGSPWAVAGGLMELEYKDNLRVTFSAGGMDITRNIIASRVLGLPR